MSKILLAGLSTVDVVQRVVELPVPGRKVQSNSVALVAGGPAANAAVAVAALGGQAALATVLGAHPLALLALRDLEQHGVSVIDLMPDRVEPPTVSAVVVREDDGERTVVSRNAVGTTITVPTDLPAADAVLVDGHHPVLALRAANTAVPVVLDAGSYKPVHDELLPLVDVCACSATYPLSAKDLRGRGVPVVIRTHGAGPVTWSCDGVSGEVWPEPVAAKDTSGAGDVWHGALTWAIGRLGRVPGAAELPALIGLANRVAAVKVRHEGPRAWVDEVRGEQW
ncbi:PfkB family carbohydrate kinase [Kutzneria viridogrisea]|uniref:Sugar/nucleoside kinase (Ribokinase family) n=1 Tax=Kutzneria viridogrisea TaxID=47990 RepID=A0ABR6BSG6_9PSEU|nr:sugar/nucleoside kinase (ribokinase family) [Kutzneria viridogrisea]